MKMKGQRPWFDDKPTGIRHDWSTAPPLSQLYVEGFTLEKCVDLGFFEFLTREKVETLEETTQDASNPGIVQHRQDGISSI